MIEVKNLVKKYGSYTAVDNLNFTIEKGHIYGLLGPNGAGKSTTMNIMTGYLGATQGEVIIDGHDILKEPEEAKKKIGYLPEMPPLYTDMTVREYLEFAAALKKLPRDSRESDIEDVEKMVKIKSVEHRLIRNLSKGYRQRVGLAQALLGFPEIIILDEPSVGLDPKQIIETRELIRTLAENHTVILSSHILAEVQEVCDYIMIISRGKLVAQDTPENLEKYMGSAGAVEIESHAEPQLVREILKTVADVAKADVHAGDKGVTSARIEVVSGKDVREDVFRAFAAQDVPLIKLNAVESGLEEVFIKLTQGDDMPEQGESADAADDGDEDALRERAGAPGWAARLAQKARDAAEAAEAEVEAEAEEDGDYFEESGSAQTGNLSQTDDLTKGGD